MNENEILHDIVYHYLTELGYRSTSIIPDAPIEKMPNAKRVDLVVYDNDLPYLLVEVKNHIPETNDPSELKFHPYVRELQTQAFALNAPYYLLTNGQIFLWFTTDLTGRPNLLATPVMPKENTKQSVVETKESIIRNLRSLQDYFQGRMNFQQIKELSALLVIAKLLNERGDNELKNYLLSESGTPYRPSTFSSLYLVNFPLLEPTYLEKAFEILDRVNLISISPLDLLKALDEVFFLDGRFHYHIPRTPRWLADFLVRLGQMSSKSKKIVMDIACGAGEILTAARLATENVDLWGIGQNAESAFWTQLQLIALGEKRPSILIEEFPSYSALELQNIPRPTHIITIPPLGRKLDRDKAHSELSKLGVLQIEDIYLEFGIKLLENQGRIVTLVPESMLFAQGRRQATRQFIKDNIRITAIISLDSGALLPYSSLKASILVLDKEKTLSDYDIFMAQIKSNIKENIFDSTKVPWISEILEQFEQWTEKHTLKPDDFSWAVSIKDLNIGNFTVNRHFPINDVKKPQIKASDRVLSIEQVALLKYGSSIKLETAGSIRVIGPAAIKAMHIDITNLNFTTEQELPSKPLLTLPGDIVLSNVGASLGKAAVISKDLANSPISRNVILIRPDRSQVIPEYLSAAINSEYVQLQLLQRATGSIIPSLSLSNLAEITIPIPDLITQHRIAQRLESAQQKIDQAQQDLEEAKSALKNLIQNLYEEE